MSRFARVLTALAVAASGTVAAAPPSAALQSLTWTFVVDCRDPDGVATDELLGLFHMPNGWYAVSSVGACAVDTQRTYAFNVSTPCTAPAVGPIPCVAPGPTVSNVPGAACWTQTNGVGVVPCGGPGVVLNGCMFVVAVDGQCLPLGAGTIYHNPGPMRARFLDTIYPDNIGAFVVTVAWTPL